MSLKTMIKITTFLLIIGATLVLGESEGVAPQPPPRPDCYKDLDKKCSNEVHDSICRGILLPPDQLVNISCAVEIRQKLERSCFDVLVEQYTQSCDADPEVSGLVAAHIWDYFDWNGMLSEKLL